MKKLVLAAAILFAISGMSYAQLSNSGTADINAKLLQGLSVSVTNSVDLGTHAIGAATISVLPVNGALFTVTGTAGSSINVTYPSCTVTLTDTSAGVTGSINFGVNLVNSPNGTTAGGTAATGSNWNLSGTYPQGTGDAYFMLGGTVNLTGTETAGNYHGTFTLTATYN